MFFVRTSAIWELVKFDALANFAGEPFTHLLVPVRQNILSVLEQNFSVVIFTDLGFEVKQSTSDMREELQELYKIHGRLPDNVTFYRRTTTW